jgi:hypothetical protein
MLGEARTRTDRGQLGRDISSWISSERKSVLSQMGRPAEGRWVRFKARRLVRPTATHIDYILRGSYVTDYVARLRVPCDDFLEIRSN